jgi:segregation and condensation protein B
VQPLAKLLEAALFAASRPLTLEELASLEPDVAESAIRAALDEICTTYDAQHGVELVEIAEGWHLDAS